MDFPDLIRLFAANRVDKIAAVQEYADLCEKHVDNFQFRTQRHATEVAKKSLEELLDSRPTYKDQVRQALIKLEAQKKIDFDLYYALIVAGYKPRWSADQQAYFERLIPTILSGNDFFLSFTSRGPALGEGDKRINRLYWYFIRGVIGADNITKADRKTKNLLAEAFYAKLLDADLKGFDYIRHEFDNSVVVEKLRSGVRGSRVFVQLVENAMFDPPVGRPNYCDIEYRHAVEFLQAEDRILFVVAGEDLTDLNSADRVHADYRTWLERVRGRAAAYLPRAEEYDSQRIHEITRRIKSVVSQVRAAREKVLEGIPAG